MSDLFKDNAKKRKIEKLLKSGVAYIYINNKSEGVSLPAEYADQPTTTLQISNNFQGSLNLEKDRIETILFFGENFEKCVVPYSALWAVGTPDHPILEIWNNELPKEVLDILQGNTKDSASAEQSGSAGNHPAKAAVIQDVEENYQEPPSSVQVKKKPAVLKVVKATPKGKKTNLKTEPKSKKTGKPNNFIKRIK